MRARVGYDMRACSIEEIRDLCRRFHGYGSVGSSSTYCFGVYESGVAVAAYIWQPPPPGAARSVCPEAPYAVLALSRMVAVPRCDRLLNHVSRPLRRQMKLIDRGRWPVLVTYHDEGQGHTGHVYKCSGWQATSRSERPVYETADGRRASSYSNGQHGTRGLKRAGSTFVQRWEDWACNKGLAADCMANNGWVRVPVPGKKWRSGNQAFTFVKADDAQLVLFGGAS